MSNREIEATLKDLYGVQSKFWLTVLTELKNRGVEDIFIACCDGLTGFPDAYAFGGAKLYETMFPKT